MSLFTGAAILGSALAAAGGSTIAAKIASGTAKDAAATNVAGVKHAADLTKQAADDTLALTKQQSENDYKNQELTRKANYDQYAAQRSRLGTLGSMLGLPAPDIPAYVASQDPNFTGPQQAGASGASAAPGAPASAGGGDAVTAAALANYKALGVNPTGPGTGPTDIAYMVSKINETGGLTPQNQSYWFGPQGRIAQEITKASSGTLASPAAPQSSAGTLGAMMAPYQTASPTAALSMQPYQGTISRLGS